MHDDCEDGIEFLRLHEEPATPKPGLNGVHHGPDPSVNEAGDDPHRLARLSLDDHTEAGVVLQRYWREEHYRWDQQAYRLLPGSELRAELCQRIKQEFDRLNVLAIKAWEKRGCVDGNGKKCPMPTARKVTSQIIGNVVQALAGMTMLPSTVEPPCWLAGDDGLPAGELLACSNGLLHLPSVASGKPTLLPPTPQFFSLNALSYPFDVLAPRPRQWLAFLKELWRDDLECIQALQEVFGYLLTADTSQQKIFLLVGPKRSGKGTIARVLARMIGEANVCGPTLAGLGTNFGLWPLLGKTVAIISDARLSGRTDIAIVVERLLSISGEDAQTIDRKNLPPVTARLKTRFLILTNELPRLNDASGALVGRIVILPLTESWYGREDTALTDKLLAELPGILLWAIEGWLRLRQRGYFVQPKTGAKLVQEMEDLSSPIGAFVRERCNVGPACEASVDELFAAWKTWCEQQGRKEPGEKQTLGRNLRSVIPHLKVEYRRQGEGRERTYIGVALKPFDQIDGGKDGSDEEQFAAAPF
jgi:putative DNA primase/helicase